MTGKPPYAGCEDPAVIAKVWRRQIPERPNDCLPPGRLRADTLWKLLAHCWAYEPAARPESTEVAKVVRAI